MTPFFRPDLFKGDHNRQPDIENTRAIWPRRRWVPALSQWSGIRRRVTSGRWLPRVDAD